MPMPVPDLSIEQLNIEVAGPCSLQCFTCPQAKVNGGREKDCKVMMTLEEFRKVLDDTYQYRHPERPLCISLHGSGEPTLNRKLPEIVRYAKSKSQTYVSFFTHGNLLTPTLSQQVIDAGINEVTVSLIGYDKETCNKSMVGGDFDRVMGNIRIFQKILRHGNYPNTKINTRHLTINFERKDWEVEQYRQNIIDPLGVEAEIWLQHNWDGRFVTLTSSREEMAKERGLTRRSCGRPNANYLEVRAGGVGGRRLAVVACPIVLGRDSLGTLGHLDTQTIAEVVAGSLYEKLRHSHNEKEFDGTFCEGCDYLYPDLKEVLVWSNKPGRKVGQSQTARQLVYPESTSVAV